MTVSELIARLSALPADTKLIMMDGGGGLAALSVDDGFEYPDVWNNALER